MDPLPLQIRFNDVDQMGHVNNAVIMEYFDLGKSTFFTRKGLPPEKGDFTVVIVHFEVDFHQQIRFHDPIAVTTQVSHIGNKSVEVFQQIINTATQQPCASCKTILSGYLRSTGTSAPIPQEVRNLLSE